MSTSPYFAASPQLRRSRRKAATTLVTAAAALMPNSTTAAGSAAFISSRALLPGMSTPCAVPSSSSLRGGQPLHVSSSSSVTPSPRRKSSPAAKAKSPSKQAKRAATLSSPPKSKAKKNKPAPVTESFEPMWSKRFTAEGDTPVPVHTLLLGTHPSITSLSQQQYYGHSMNAFWWIAGDCLGFRRASGVSESTGKPYHLAKDLRYPPNHILPYEQQVEKLAQQGFALWDVVASCERPGSLDQDIRNEAANPIREFCDQQLLLSSSTTSSTTSLSNSKSNPNQLPSTLKRIVLCNGGTGSSMFVKHFRDWLETGDLMALEGHEASQKAFGSAIRKGEKKRQKLKLEQRGCGDDENTVNNKIVLISALSVSPAAARYTYKEKRDFWDQHVYAPGLQDFEEKNNNNNLSS